MRAIDYTLIAVSFIWIVSDMVIQRTNRAKDSSKDRSSLVILLATNFPCVFLGIYIALSQEVGNILRENLFLNYIGVTLVIIGVIVRWTAIYQLK